VIFSKTDEKNGMKIFKRILGLELTQGGSIGEICRCCGAFGSGGKDFLHLQIVTI
jgi:hypothetical protein